MSSVQDDTDVAGRGQSVSADRICELLESNRAARRLAVGVMSRRDVCDTFGIGPDTLALWVERGLPTFKPGTGKAFFLASDVAEFFAKRETFPGRKHQAKRPRPRGGRR